MAFLKKLLTLGIICLIGYLFLGYHYIVIDKSIKMLKKSELTLKYTFFSTKGKPIEKALEVPELWDDGIGELLVKMGKLTEEELEAYAAKKAAQEEEGY
ncbi:MAG: hypothetical protein GX654_03775 [Desulfatiglans sp.]|jgi:hypothetical protein|nr:hypothetical protein [Desulfatiglans sp.]